MQDTFPSWLFSVKHGATTIWERWDGWTPEKGFQDPGMNSFNHYSLGSCGQWLYDRWPASRPDPEQPGLPAHYHPPARRRRPDLGSASSHSIRGRIASQWKVEGSDAARTFTLRVAIPANTTATVYVPAADAAAVTESGQPAEKAPGVQPLRVEGNALVFEVGSGSVHVCQPGTPIIALKLLGRQLYCRPGVAVQLPLQRPEWCRPQILRACAQTHGPFPGPWVRFNMPTVC